MQLLSFLISQMQIVNIIIIINAYTICTIQLLMVPQHLNIVLYCIGDIKGTTCVTTPEIFVAQSSHTYTYNELPPPVHNHLAQHPAVATVLLVMQNGTSLDYWYRHTVTSLPAWEFQINCNSKQITHTVSIQISRKHSSCAVFDSC